MISQRYEMHSGGYPVLESVVTRTYMEGERLARGTIVRNRRAVERETWDYQPRGTGRQFVTGIHGLRHPVLTR